MLPKPFRYSPYHNIPSSDVTMPPMLFFHSDYDDLVPPLNCKNLNFLKLLARLNFHQAYKHVAALQHRFPDGPNPILLRMDMSSGHWAGKVCVSLLHSYLK